MEGRTESETMQSVTLYVSSFTCADDMRRAINELGALVDGAALIFDLIMSTIDCRDECIIAAVDYFAPVFTDAKVWRLDGRSNTFCLAVGQYAPQLDALGFNSASLLDAYVLLTYLRYPSHDMSAVIAAFSKYNDNFTGYTEVISANCVEYGNSTTNTNIRYFPAFLKSGKFKPRRCITSLHDIPDPELFAYVDFNAVLSSGRTLFTDLLLMFSCGYSGERLANIIEKHDVVMVEDHINMYIAEDKRDAFRKSSHFDDIKKWVEKHNHNINKCNCGAILWALHRAGYNVDSYSFGLDMMSVFNVIKRQKVIRELREEMVELIKDVAEQTRNAIYADLLAPENALRTGFAQQYEENKRKKQKTSDGKEEETKPQN
jgi:hypothetical protein